MKRSQRPTKDKVFPIVPERASPACEPARGVFSLDYRWTRFVFVLLFEDFDLNVITVRWVNSVGKQSCWRTAWSYFERLVIAKVWTDASSTRCLMTLREALLSLQPRGWNFPQISWNFAAAVTQLFQNRNRTEETLLACGHRAFMFLY